MLKDGMSLCNSCGRSTSGVECTNPGCQDALASARLASVTAERDALSAQLAALKKRVADAPRHMLYPRDEGEKTAWVAHLPLEDGE